MSDNFVPAKKFFDEANYPHGFSRSGDYTVRESEVLTAFGTRLSLLSSGKAQPETADEEHFLDAINDRIGEDEWTFVEKTWKKYDRLIHEVKRFYSLAADGYSTTAALADDNVE